MLLPVAVSQIGIPDGGPAVQHETVSHINAAMGNAVHAGNGFLKENQIARLCFLRRNLLAGSIQTGGSQSAYVTDAAVGKHIRHKT